MISKVEEIHGKIESQKYVYNSRIFHLFLDAIYHIASEIEGTTVIVRPHPSEDNTTYEREFARHDNIVVEDSGDVRTWIAGAQATIHHDCTTGIESALMGAPTVSYRPIQNEEYESELPIFVSSEARTPDSLADYVLGSIESDDPYELTNKQKNYLKKYFHNIDRPAAERICSIIEEVELRENKLGGTLRPSVYDRFERRIKSSRWESQTVVLYDAFHQLIGDRSPRERRQYRNQKFPGLTKEEVEENISQLDKYLKINNTSVESVHLTDNTFYLYNK